MACCYQNTICSRSTPDQNDVSPEAGVRAGSSKSSWIALATTLTCGITYQFTPGGPDPIAVLQQVFGARIALGRALVAGAAEAQLFVAERQLDGARAAVQHRPPHADVVVLVLAGHHPRAVDIPARAEEVREVAVAETLAEPILTRLNPLRAQAEGPGRPVQLQPEPLPAALHIHRLEVVEAVRRLAAQAVEAFRQVAVRVRHPHAQRPERRRPRRRRAGGPSRSPAPAKVGPEVVLRVRRELRLGQLADVAVGVEEADLVAQPAPEVAARTR